MSSDHIEIGARVPRAHRPTAQRIARALLQAFGWRLDIRLPDQPRLVVLMAPHTSNWDGLYGILAMVALGIRIHWFGKHTLFHTPLRGLLLWLGGIPLDRTAPGGVVAQMIESLRTQPQFIFGLAPEGTRSRAPKWKRGFHSIARGTGATVVCAYLDYRDKVVGTGPAFVADEAYEADLARIQAFYRTITPKIAANFAAES